MRHRPLALFAAALLFAYFPLALFLNWKEGMRPTGVDIVLSVVLPCLLIVGLLKVSKIGWYTLIALVALWGVRDLYEYYATTDSSTFNLCVHLAIYCISLGYFINPRIRHLYFDPKLRWWRTKPRFETHAPLLYRHEGEWQYPVMRNISEGGCFVETPHPIAVGSVIRIAIPLPIPLSVSVVQIEGEVRWVSVSPARFGMGIQFRNPARLHDRAIREYVARQL